MNEVLRFKNYSFTYDNVNYPALHDINFKINQGDFVTDNIIDDLLKKTGKVGDYDQKI